MDTMIAIAMAQNHGVDKNGVVQRMNDLLLEDKNEQICINYTKKHFNWYLKGFAGASKIRRSFMKVKTIDEIKKILSEL